MAFIAYFDFLGFKDFIERNDIEFQIRIVNGIFREIEEALGKGKLEQRNGGYVADLSQSKIHCVNFSDTVLFWTYEEDIDFLKELIEVAYRFNWSCIDFHFPLRGAILKGDIFDYKFDHKSDNGGTYGVNSIFGIGLVNAHIKAESQNWAGTVIDNSIIDFLTSAELAPDEFLSPYAKTFLVPYKEVVNDQVEEWVLNIVETKEGINDEAYGNLHRRILDNFANYNKRVDSEKVQVIIKNTINFLESGKTGEIDHRKPE